MYLLVDQSRPPLQQLRTTTSPHSHNSYCSPQAKAVASAQVQHIRCFLNSGCSEAQSLDRNRQDDMDWLVWCSEQRRRSQTQAFTQPDRRSAWTHRQEIAVCCHIKSQSSLVTRPSPCWGFQGMGLPRMLQVALMQEPDRKACCDVPASVRRNSAPLNLNTSL